MLSKEEIEILKNALEALELMGYLTEAEQKVLDKLREM